MPGSGGGKLRGRGLYCEADGDTVSEMKIAPAESLVVFALAERQFALGISVVARIVRAVEITPLTGAPAGVCGGIDVEGSVIPVFDLRPRFGFPAREVRTTDHFVIAHAAHRIVALLVESVVGVVPRSESAATSAEEIAGAATIEDGIVFIHDPGLFLSLEDEPVLDAALKG